MTTYTVTTGEGGELGTAQDYEAAVKVAQREANERGETVYVAGPGLHTAGAVKGSDEDIGEAVEPLTRDDVVIHAAEVSAEGWVANADRETVQGWREWLPQDADLDGLRADLKRAGLDPEVSDDEERAFVAAFRSEVAERVAERFFNPAKVDGHAVKIVSASVDEESGEAEIRAKVWGKTVEVSLLVEREVPNGWWTIVPDSEIPQSLFDVGNNDHAVAVAIAREMVAQIR